jgi:hypothetical protein
VQRQPLFPSDKALVTHRSISSGWLLSQFPILHSNHHHQQRNSHSPMIPFANLAALSALAALVVTPANAADHFPLTHRALSTVRTRTNDDWRAYRDFVHAKFSPNNKTTDSAKFRRASTSNVPLTDLGFDTTYFAPVSIGTPVSSPPSVLPHFPEMFPTTMALLTLDLGMQGQSFNVILDTGSRFVPPTRLPRRCASRR